MCKTTTKALVSPQPLHSRSLLFSIFVKHTSSCRLHAMHLESMTSNSKQPTLCCVLSCSTTFVLKLFKKHPQVSVDKVAQQAVILLSWRPLSPCRCKGHLLVQNPGGGRWKFPVVLVAQDAKIDGTLICEANFGCTASVPVNIFASGAVHSPPFLVHRKQLFNT
jgi:hypothetical protein